MRQKRWLSVMAGAFASVGIMMLACVGGPAPDGSGCAAENPAAQIEVSGTFRYSGKLIFQVRVKTFGSSMVIS